MLTLTKFKMENIEVQETAEVKEEKAEDFKRDDLKALVESAVDKAVEKAGINKIDLEKAKLPTAEVEFKDSRKELNQKMRKFIHQTMVKGNIEGATSSGTTVSVPVEFSKELAKLLNEHGIVRKYAKVIPMNTMKLTINALDTQATPSWNGQAVAKDSTNDTFRDVTLVRNTLAFIKPVSKELMQDATFDFAGELLEISKNAILQEEDKQGFMGSGAPITGLTNVSGTKTVTLNHQLSNSLTYGKIVDLVYAPEGRKTENTKLYCHRSVWSKIAQLEDGNGNIIGAGQNLNAPNFEGIPVVFVEDMTPATNDSTGVSYVVCGDLKNVVMGVREDYNVNFSEHATIDGVNMFETNQVAFRIEEAVDIKVLHPKAFSVLKSKS